MHETHMFLANLCYDKLSAYFAKQEAEIERLKLKVEMYESDPQTKFVMQKFHELSSGDKNKIMKFMEAIKELNNGTT
jgi:hypothetical protein